MTSGARRNGGARSREWRHTKAVARDDEADGVESEKAEVQCGRGWAGSGWEKPGEYRARLSNHLAESASAGFSFDIPFPPVTGNAPHGRTRQGSSAVEQGTHKPLVASSILALATSSPPGISGEKTAGSFEL